MILQFFIVSNPVVAQRRCVCTVKGDFVYCHLSPSLAHQVPKAQAYCSTGWTCDNRECAYYENLGEPSFGSPVVNVTFETAVVERHVKRVVFTADCPDPIHVAIQESCLFEVPDIPPTQFPTNLEDPKVHSGSNELDPILIGAIVGAVICIVTAGCVLTVLMCRLKNSRFQESSQRSKENKREEDQDRRNLFRRQNINIKSMDLLSSNT